MTVVNDYSKLAFVDRTVTAYTTPAIVPIDTAGTQTPVFCIHPIEGLTSCYADLATRLGADRPVYGVQASPVDARPGSIAALASHYADEILEVSAAGPVNLLGLSFGGLLAHAIAVELQQRGSDVDSLTLLGSDPLHHDGEAPHDMLTRMGDDIDRSRAEELLAAAAHNESLADRHFPGVYVGIALIVSDEDSVGGPAWHPFISGEVLKYNVPQVDDFAVVGELVKRFI